MRVSCLMWLMLIGLLHGAPSWAASPTQSTCTTYLATTPSPTGIPSVTGPGVAQRSALLADGGKLVAIGARYYTVSIPAAFHTATQPVVIFNLHGTGGYPEAEWSDWHTAMTAQGYAFIGLSWGGGAPGAATDTEIYAQIKQIFSEVGANCPIATANKWLMGFSVGSAMSFAVIIRDVADQKLFRGQLAVSGAAIGPLTTGKDVMHATVEANRSNMDAMRGIQSWMYCGEMDLDHTWSMCTEMPNGEAFVNEHGGQATLYRDPTGEHHSLPASITARNAMFSFVASVSAIKTQTIGAIGFLPTSLVVGGTATAQAAATSGLAVSFSSLTPGVCSVSGGTVTGISTGTCTIAATQAGNADYSAATQVTQNITVGSLPTTTTTTTTSTTTTSTTATSTTTTTLAATSINFTAGWNLVGNGIEAPMTVATTLNDANQVMTVWQWVTAGSTAGIAYPAWAFYTPSQNDGGKAYAAGKGYDFLTTIKAGEGFWVNAKTGFTTLLPTGATVQSSSFMASAGAHALPSGWSLIAIGDSQTPAGFNAKLSATPPAAGTTPANLTTLWAWDASRSSWYFWAPSLASSGGLAAYLSSKSYLDFASMPTTPTGTLSPTTGFWVNMPQPAEMPITAKGFNVNVEQIRGTQSDPVIPAKERHPGPRSGAGIHPTPSYRRKPVSRECPLDSGSSPE